MKVLVTGHAGFIGFHTASRLLERGDDVVGFDIVSDYYDPQLKQARLRELENSAAISKGSYVSILKDLADREAVDSCFAEHSFDRVIHLAAQAGVRYSLENPHSYIESNVVAFINILEACRRSETLHLTTASSSSVYGANTTMPFSEKQSVDHPLQLYAATKRAGELMAHAYSHLFRMPITNLRFFTVYGPWGRPDMALFKFTKSIIENQPIDVYNYGNHSRDFTYVDDTVEGVIRASDDIARSDSSWSSDNPRPDSSSAPFRIFNIGNSRPVKLKDFIAALEEALGKKAILNLLPMQAGDVPDTFADSSKLANSLGYKPCTSVQDGVSRFVHWYQNEYMKLIRK